MGNMRVIICLGQGGLRSLSASSWHFRYGALAVMMHSGHDERISLINKSGMCNQKKKGGKRTRYKKIVWLFERKKIFLLYETSAIMICICMYHIF